MNMSSRAWSFGRVGAVRAARASLVLGVLLVALNVSWQRQLIAQPGPCVATTASGDVAGQLRGGVCAYVGVPYAAPPLGSLRWRLPQPRAPWGPVPFDATSNVRQCRQLNAAGLAAGNEDCLVLNVWAPAAPPGRRPVLVWLHTGAFQAASSNLPASDGRRFAEERGVVVVAPNYRLGAFGFLAHPALTSEDPAYPSSGNYGLADQRAALQWVRDNIAAFGGDPRNVTLAGTSAGGVSVTLHLASPASRGLFHRAIMQSTYAMSRWVTIDEGEAQGEAFAAALGCNDRATAAACLRSKSDVEVVTASRPAQQQVAETPGILWVPVVDGVEIPDQARELYRQGRVARIPVIIGVNGDEGWTYVDRSFPGGLDELQYERAVRTEFGMDASAILDRYSATAFSTPKDALARLVADVEFVCEARRVARYLHHNGSPVYVYSFEYGLPEVTSGRAAHGVESNFVFGNDFAPAPNLGLATPRPLTAADMALFGAMSSYWREFAATGSPNVRGTPVQWPTFESDLFGAPRVPERADRYLRFDRVITEARYIRDSQCNFWERFYFRSVLGTMPAAAR
jgi:para-nitrobenzyl esterase